MKVAIDFGTSNCAAGYVKNGTPMLIDLEENSNMMPTAIYVEKVPVEPKPVNEAFVKDKMRKEKTDYTHDKYMELLYDLKLHKDGEAITFEEEKMLTEQAEVLWENEKKNIEYLVRNAIRSDNVALARDKYAKQSFREAIEGEGKIYFGSQAQELYISDPDNGIYVASPKSFIGADINKEYRAHFVLVISQIMKHIKMKLEESLGDMVTDVVIGRPVKFHGTMGEKGNVQALDILRTAALQAGFEDVEFLEEPIAAAFHYEKQLLEDKTVLVVDIGGGTTDCTVVQLGPSHTGRKENEGSVLSMTGDRIGGTDLDIDLASKLIMPYFGKGGVHKYDSIPNSIFYDAVTVTDIQAKNRFSSVKTADDIRKYYNLSDNDLKEKLKRLLVLQEGKYQYRLNKDAETAKIMLSDSDEYVLNLEHIEEDLEIPLKRKAFSEAVSFNLSKISNLMREAKDQADKPIDVVYVTGGTAKSPVIKDMIKKHFGNVEIVVGDYFGSVGLGLVEWTQLQNA